MKNLKSLGTILTKTEQKNIFAGGPPPPPGLTDPCPCSSNYTTGGGDSCMYPAKRTVDGFPFEGSMCLGTIQDGMCCVD